MAQTLTAQTNTTARNPTVDGALKHFRGTVTVVDNYVTGGITIPVPPGLASIHWAVVDSMPNGTDCNFFAGYAQPNLLQLFVRSTGAEVANTNAAAAGYVYEIDVWGPAS